MGLKETNMTISEVIKDLQEIQKQYGDLPLMGSSDDEQNSSGDDFEVKCRKQTNN